MSFLYKLCKELVTGFKVLFAGDSLYVALRSLVALFILRKDVSAIFHDLSKVRIYVIIVLNVIFMGRR